MFQLLFSNKDTKMKMTSLVGLIVVSVFSLCFIASSEATRVVGQEKGNNGVGGGQEKGNNGVGGGQEKGNNGVGGGQEKGNNGVGGGQEKGNNGVGGGQEKGNNGVGGGQEKGNNGVGGGQEKGNNGNNDDATPAPEFEEAAFDSKFMFISTVFCFLYSRF